MFQQINQRVFFSLFSVVSIFLLCFEIQSTREDAVRDIYNAIYEDVDDAIPCVRLLNSTSTVGCSTQRSGVIGILRYFDDYDAIKTFKNSISQVNEDIIAVLNSTLLSSELIDELYATQKVVGIILVEGPPPPRSIGFSPDSKYPNQNSGSFAWNPKGNNLLFRTIPLPIFTVNTQKSEEIRQRALHNAESNTYPYWAAELTAWMHGNENSEVCLRRGLCLPLAGHSVWTSLQGPLNSTSPSEFVIAMTSMDSSSLFQQRNIGAESDMSNLIATLVALDTLTHIDKSNLTRQIIFMFFDGESWGNLGSRKFIHDVTNFSCVQYNEDKTMCLNPSYTSLEFLNLLPSKIHAIIELKQVGNRQNGGKKQLYIHQNRHDQNNQIVRTVLSAATNLSDVIVSLGSNVTPGIPPSSLTQFIAAINDLESRGVVISDHSAEYVNPFYHSHFDNIHNIDSEIVCSAATLLARSLLLLATNTSFSDLNSVVANCSLVSSLIDCFVTNVTCPLAVEYIPELKTAIVHDPTPSHYVGVWNSLSLTSRFVHDFVFYATHFNMQPNRCNQTQDCNSKLGEICLLNQCVVSATYYHDAFSTGLSYNPNSSPQWKITDPSLPNWTEPFWGPIGMRLFLYGNFVMDVIFFFISLVEVGVSFGGLILFKKFFPSKWQSLFG